MDDATSKKCRPLWREAHLEVKSVKVHHIQTLLRDASSKKCTPLWHEAHVEVKVLKRLGSRSARRRGEAKFGSQKCHSHQSRSTCGRCNLVQAAVARSAFGSQQCENMSPSDYFRTLETKMCRRPRREAPCEVKTKEIEGFWAFLSVRTDRDG